MVFHVKGVHNSGVSLFMSYRCPMILKMAASVLWLAYIIVCFPFYWPHFPFVFNVTVTCKWLNGKEEGKGGGGEKRHDMRREGVWRQGEADVNTVLSLIYAPGCLSNWNITMIFFPYSALSFYHTRRVGPMFSPPVALALYTPSSVFQKLHVEDRGNWFDHAKEDLEVADCVSLTGGRRMCQSLLF